MSIKFDDKPIKALQESLVEAGYLTAELILTEANKLVPRDTGTLGRSGTITFENLPNPQSIYSSAKSGRITTTAKPVNKLNIKKLYISFNTPYAHRQHEDLQFNHPNGGEAKYLEKAWNKNIKRYRELYKQICAKKGLLPL